MKARAFSFVAGVFLTFAVAVSWGQTTNPSVAPRITNPAAVNAVDDQDLINKLTGVADFGGGGPKDPARALQAVMGRMDQSSTRLADKNPDAQTQEIQHRIVTDLDKLIELLRQQQNPHPSGTRSPPAPATSSRRRNVSVQRMDAGRTATAGNATSQPRFGAPTSPAAADDLLEKRVEGMNLPPRDRGAILNGITHGCLPEYRDRVCRYYEALAKLRSTRPAR